MEACLLLLPQLLLLGTAILTLTALETADLVELCGRTWQGDALLLSSHAASRKFYFVAPDTDCGLWMRAAASGDRILFQFRFFLVYSLTPASPGSPGSPAPPASNASFPEPADPCAPGSYLQFYEGSPGAPRPLGSPLCGLTIPASVASSGPSLGLRLVTRGRQPRVDFVGEVTSFRLGSCGSYFRCRNGRCIPPSLVCDHWGMDNCGDGSDQASRPPADCRGISPVPSWARSVDDQASKPLTLSPALGPADPLQTAADRSPPAGRDPAPQDAAAKGSRLWGLALASSLLLASTGLLLGLLCCCCSGRLPWRAGTCGICLGCSTGPDRVAPGGLRPSGPACQSQGGHP
ncbi:low-density lipoprotein receptor class A domain-containing protein 2 [Choloepus didactylus]|uniref:low-density lipoprotein receptor class A domain-containing protein 2 n=1 Tax=Choloepus didactylus TaxID=27675 RepID=UPI0018A07840|nr:low-density lipoprotein receptor class A domain-containing protein 2 [Choloepus didactylus]